MFPSWGHIQKGPNTPTALAGKLPVTGVSAHSLRSNCVKAMLIGGLNSSEIRIPIFPFLEGAALHSQAGRPKPMLPGEDMGKAQAGGVRGHYGVTR